MMNQCSVNDTVDKSNPAYFLSCMWTLLTFIISNSGSLYMGSTCPTETNKDSPGMWPDDHLSVRCGPLVPREFAVSNAIHTFHVES